MTPANLSTGPQARHRGVYELALAAPAVPANPCAEVSLRVTFTRPDGRPATVDGFYDGMAADGMAADGSATYKARAYCDTLGPWRWASRSTLPALDGQSGTFEVVPSTLKGKLRLHPGDPHQFATDDGGWFLHLGDTGYRYLTDGEPEWQAYLDQAARMGATKVRAWFCRGRSDVQALYDGTRDARGRRPLYLPYWQEIDRRLCYALETHPGVQFVLIPYGEDTEELRRYDAGDPDAALIAQYAQARFSALPNVYWCISNDREIVADEARPLQGRQVYARTIDRLGREMAAREPWGTLLTNHQCRWSGYTFVDAPWSDLITLEDVDQVDGAVLVEYRARRAAPAVNDEDRYELYRPPLHPRYFFRRLMWGSLLSGGHATYGGLHTYQPYQQDALSGVRGYFDAVRDGKLAGGARDFVHIHRFFRESGLTLVGLTPDDACVGGQPRRWKCIHDETTYVVYLANPGGDDPGTDAVAETAPAVTVHLPEQRFDARWYDPRSGAWHPGPALEGGPCFLAAPGPGDWLLVLERAG